MVMDRNGRSHRPSGLPAQVAGTYDGRGRQGGVDLAPFDASEDIDISGVDRTRWRSRTLARRDAWLEARRGCLWMDELLRATEVGADGVDHTGESVMSPEKEIDMMQRAVYREVGEGRDVKAQYGPIMRALISWFPNEAQCRDLAQQIAENRLIALRRSCVTDPTKCYSEALAGYALTRMPVKVESLLAGEPYRMPAHHIRVGSRFRRRCEEWKAAHDNHKPPLEVRDRLWDETMDAFIADKEARGVSYGGGMYHSDGTDANPHHTSGRIRRGADGRPYNMRDAFERRLRDVYDMLGVDYGDLFDDLERTTPATGMNAVADEALEAVDRERAAVKDLLGPNGESLHAMWEMARERGYDLHVLATTMHIPDAVGDEWGWDA